MRQRSGEALHFVERPRLRLEELLVAPEVLEVELEDAALRVLEGGLRQQGNEEDAERVQQLPRPRGIQANALEI